MSYFHAPKTQGKYYKQLQADYRLKETSTGGLWQMYNKLKLLSKSLDLYLYIYLLYIFMYINRGYLTIYTCTTKYKMDQPLLFRHDPFYKENLSMINGAQKTIFIRVLRPFIIK